MRGSWSRKCLEPHAKRLLERYETVDGVLAGREIGRWVQNVLAVAEVCLGIIIAELSRLTRESRRNTTCYLISYQFLPRLWSQPRLVP
jgi:exocyst complex protein 7